MKAPIGVFGCRWGFSVSERHWQQSRASAKEIIPRRHDKHYEEIVRGFGNAALRASPTPMSDRELSRAIAEFLRDAPSVDSVSALGRRLDPTSRR
jgi:hypothetical protein